MIGEYMLQGVMIVECNGQFDEIIVGVLLYDIGYFMLEFGIFSMEDIEDCYYEDVGVEVFERFFLIVVIDCCCYYVVVKWYLCVIKLLYFECFLEVFVYLFNF